MKVITIVLVGGLGVLTCLAALFDAFDQPALADRSKDVARTEDESPKLDDPLPVAVERSATQRALRQSDPFASYPTGPGARSYESLDPEERRVAETSQQRGDIDHGDHVHQAFTRATALGVRRARAKTAERDVDLVGAARLGVR